MDNKRGACLVCGKPLQYFETERELTCALCGKTFFSSASCMDGHYVCDECHARQGVEVILEHCKKSASRDPVALAREIMADPYIYMHGNEHHILVGAVLLTAYRNAGGRLGGDARQGVKVPRRVLRLLGVLRRGGQRGDVLEHRHRHHSPLRQELGPGQPPHRRRPGRHRRDRRAPVL